MALSAMIQQGQVFLVPVGIISVLIAAIYTIKKVFRAIRVFLLARIFPTDLKSYGDWAVITGGSSGIGRSYAREIARRGVNTVIISNELEALELTAEEIKEEFSVECCYIHIDFTSGQEAYGLVERVLADKDIGILVNGAGILGNAPCYFIEESDSNILTMIDLHISSVVMMTMKVLPLMLKKKKGIIINISSFASFKPLPLWSIYSSCKSFSNRLTKALCLEYSDKGLKFQLITPSFVNTRMTENLKFILKSFYPSVNTFVQSAVQTIGKTEHTTGYWRHELIWFLVEHISEKPIEQVTSPSILKKKRKYT